jgi:hypothetical protein
MKHAFACILAIAGWYLLYPVATHKGSPDCYPALPQWDIDSSYDTDPPRRSIPTGGRDFGLVWSVGAGISGV